MEGNMGEKRKRPRLGHPRPDEQSTRQNELPTNPRVEQSSLEPIHMEALTVVDEAMDVVNSLNSNSQIANFNEQKIKGVTVGQWLKIQKNKILSIYGVEGLDPVMANSLKVPERVRDFVQYVSDLSKNSGTKNF